MSKMEPIERFVDLDKPSLRGLSYALRHRETWPPGFKWNYDICSNCAMGLASRLWKEIEWIIWYDDVAAAFSMPHSAAHRIFVDAAKVRGWRDSASWGITPEMIADDIDDYLEKTS